jgi:hypothetical protein
MIRLRVSHEEAERDLQWRIGSREDVVFLVKDVENVTLQQRNRRAAWLKGESQPAGE